MNKLQFVFHCVKVSTGFQLVFQPNQTTRRGQCEQIMAVFLQLNQRTENVTVKIITVDPTESKTQQSFQPKLLYNKPQGSVFVETNFNWFTLDQSEVMVVSNKPPGGVIVEKNFKFKSVLLYSGISYQ
jgi:hypothetical protein